MSFWLQQIENIVFFIFVLWLLAKTLKHTPLMLGSHIDIRAVKLLKDFHYAAYFFLFQAAYWCFRSPENNNCFTSLKNMTLGREVQP